MKDQVREVGRNAVMRASISDPFSDAGRYIAFSPKYWSRKTRRRFLVLLPIAAPLWVVLLTAIVAALLVKDLLHPLAHFWNAPRRVRFDYCDGCSHDRLRHSVTRRGW